MRKLRMALVAVAATVLIAGCESKEEKEYRTVANEIVEVYKQFGLTIPADEIDKAINAFKSADSAKREMLLKEAKHKLERNKAGKELKKF